MSVGTALMFAIGGVPFVFLVPLLFICCTQKVIVATIMGAIYGVVSLIYAYILVSVVAVAFIQYPLIAIVPRIFVGLFASLSYKLASKLIKSNSKFLKLLPYAIATIVGISTNTFLVIGSLVAFAPSVALGDVTILLAVPSMLVSYIIELVAMTIIVPPLCVAVSKALKLEKTIIIKDTKTKNQIEEN